MASKYSKRRCPCGQRACQAWYLEGIGDGNAFTEKEADLLLSLLRIHEAKSAGLHNEAKDPEKDIDQEALNAALLNGGFLSGLNYAIELTEHTGLNRVEVLDLLRSRVKAVQTGTAMLTVESYEIIRLPD